MTAPICECVVSSDGCSADRGVSPRSYLQDWDQGSSERVLEAEGILSPNIIHWNV